MRTRFGYWVVPERLQVTQETWLLGDLEFRQRNFIVTQTGLKVPLIRDFDVFSRINWDWDQRPQPGQVSNDVELKLGLGYSW